MDEYNSNLDSKTETLIQRSIQNYVRTNQKTCILITHRVSKIIEASKILVLDKGELLEFGTHEHLISLNNSVYSKICT
jgi:ATP-binding cassette subfamily B multidrug efflux pump